MIGSRLLFSGYGIGFKSKPLHAGFLGQDVLLVHDEAHLEPAFQELIQRIESEQHERQQVNELPWRKLRLTALTATACERDETERNRPLELSDDDRADLTVRARIHAKKTLSLHEIADEKKLVDAIADLALNFEDQVGRF
jgi:CRISPR-associated endonuclease/helicase Cas3